MRERERECVSCCYCSHNRYQNIDIAYADQYSNSHISYMQRQLLSRLLLRNLPEAGLHTDTPEGENDKKLYRKMSEREREREIERDSNRKRERKRER